MNEHDEILDRYLGGEASLEDLPEALQAEEQRLLALLESVREEPSVSPDLYRAVMAEITATRTPLWRRALDWLLRPRTIRLSPAVGGLAVAAIAAIVLFVSDSQPPADAGGAEGVVTRFVFIAPEASSVQITGDFVDWSPEGIALEEERATGIWTVDVPLEPGVYQYAFVVDGVEWRPDPRAVSTVDDGFGRENSVVIVSEGGVT